MYFDTSVILSLYAEDAFTPLAEAFYEQHVAEAMVSAWVDVELKSALAFLVRTKRLTLDGARTALEAYDDNCAQGVYQRVSLSSSHFEAGRQALALDGQLRAGDALHLGTAKVAKLALVTSDKVRFQAAGAAGVACTYLPDLQR